MNKIKIWIGDSLCSFAFWYDEKFLSDLSYDEKDWSKWQIFKWKISHKTYLFGCWFHK